MQVFKVRLHQRQAVLQAVAAAFDAIGPGRHRQQPRLEDPLGFEAVPHQAQQAGPGQAPLEQPELVEFNIYISQD